MGGAVAGQHLSMIAGPAQMAAGGYSLGALRSTVTMRQFYLLGLFCSVANVALLFQRNLLA
jgi:hypothetical protein